jgi:hypothetical protein
MGLEPLCLGVPKAVLAPSTLCRDSSLRSVVKVARCAVNGFLSQVRCGLPACRLPGTGSRAFAPTMVVANVSVVEVVEFSRGWMSALVV